MSRTDPMVTRTDALLREFRPSLAAVGDGEGSWEG
jgi:hypothetical protein